MNVLDVPMILERLKRLAEYLEFLNRRKGLTYQEFVGDKTNEWSVERALQISIQIIIDIANHILVTSSNLTPEDYSDAILKLGTTGVIPREYAERIAPMPGFRNILVHGYAELDPRLVYKNWQEEMDDFVEFARYITEWLDKQGLLKDNK